MMFLANNFTKNNLKNLPILNFKRFLNIYHLVPILLICIIFCIIYGILSLVRHNNFQSFGFDLGINDQIIWKYSRFLPPLTTIDHVTGIPKLFVHAEFFYILLSPLFWIWNDVRLLLLVQSAVFCSSAIPIFLISKKYNISFWIRVAVLFAYLTFFGVQHALWFDFHSSVFGTAFTAWFLYFLVSGNVFWSLVSFVLAIISKENVAGTLFLICGVYYLLTKRKIALYYVFGSFVYLLFIFGIYFRFIVPTGYRFDNPTGLFSNLNPFLMIDTIDKRNVYLYSLLSFGFLPIFSPVYLMPILGNLASYFILGQTVTTAQGLYLQYRIELAPLLAWATLETLRRKFFLNKNIVAVGIFLGVALTQYFLHLPLSYLAKQWFWHRSESVTSINSVITKIPEDAAVVTQNNIIPHLSHREEIYMLWPIKQDFSGKSPCGKKTCDWFRWDGNPQYVFVDLSVEWNILHLMANREDFIRGIENLEKDGNIRLEYSEGSSRLYKVINHPSVHVRI